MCNDNWDKACQQLHQDSCDCYSKLIMAHADDRGEDRIDEAQLYISHENGCQEYEQFFKKLVRNERTVLKQLECADQKGYLQQPFSTYGKGKYNMKCCCQSHIVHRESDKFMIANEAPYDQKLNRSGIFEYLEDGDPEIIQKSFDNIKGIQDHRKFYFPRKEEVHEILCFLLDSAKRLIISGPSGISRVPTIAKAIRYAVEHDFEAT